MIRKILLSSFMILIVCSFVFWNHTPGTAVKVSNKVITCDKIDGTLDPTYKDRVFAYKPIVLEGERYGGDYWLGPEIEMTGLTGFWDYQYNGEVQPHIYRHDASNMYAVYMTSLDSGDFNGSRRCKISWSSNDGDTWEDLGVYPNVKSGYCSVNAKADGSGVMGNHYSAGFPQFNAAGFINYDLAPGAGSFQGVQTPPNMAWPFVSRMTNGNILEVGATFQAAAATDTIQASVFNSTTNLFTTTNRLISPVGIAGQSNQCMSMATAPGGVAMILDDPYRETAGNFLTSRIYAVKSTDNGVTWGSFVLLYNPVIMNGDTICPNQNGACDIIIDNAGNYYWVFNANSPARLYVSGRLVAGKNNTAPQVIAGTRTSPIHPIPQVAESMVAQAFISNFDHPSLALSEDQQYVFVTYSVPFALDTIYTFNKCHLFYQYAKTSDMIWSNPVQITQSGPNSFDERYCTINKVAVSESGGFTLYLAYQKKPFAGAFARPDAGAPECRSIQVFRKIHQAQDTLIGIRNNQSIVKEFRLEQNYPNPFNPTTTINYALPKESIVTIKVYDITGKEILTLVNGKQSAGNKEVVFDATNLPSGVYFYTIKAGAFSDTKKMVLVK
jgi:hypothetical protein